MVPLPCSVSSSDNYVTIKACSRNVIGGVTPANRQNIISFSKKSLALLGLNMIKTQHMYKTLYKTKILKAIAHTIKTSRPILLQPP